MAVGGVVAQIDAADRHLTRLDGTSDDADTERPLGDLGKNGDDVDFHGHPKGTERSKK